MKREYEFERTAYPETSHRYLLSLIGLILLTVPFAVAALAIKLDSKGPGLLPAAQTQRLS